MVGVRRFTRKRVGRIRVVGEETTGRETGVNGGSTLVDPRYD